MGWRDYPRLSVSSSRYINVYNKHTGQTIVIDRYFSKYLKMSQGFMNMLRLECRFLKHITLTQAKESYSPKILNNFMMALKKRFGKFLYIWSVEVQEKRFEKYGDKVLHWHIMVAFDYNIGLDFGADDIRKIASYWKYGGCEVSAVRRPSVGYLMKYITKSLNADVGFQIKRMACSRISSFYRQSWKKLAPAIDRLTTQGLPLEQWQSVLSWDYRGGFVVVDEEVRIRRGRLQRMKEKFYVYRHPQSEWSLLGGCDMYGVFSACGSDVEDEPF